MAELLTQRLGPPNQRVSINGLKLQKNQTKTNQNRKRKTKTLAPGRRLGRRAARSIPHTPCGNVFDLRLSVAGGPFRQQVTPQVPGPTERRQGRAHALCPVCPSLQIRRARSHCRLV